MNPATLLLILQITQLVEAELPQAVLLVRQLHKSLETDPAVPNALKLLAEDTSAEAQQALDKIKAWQSNHA